MVDALRAGDPAAIGPYTLLGVLGEGGQGTVYLGRRDGVDVAVKLMHARFAADAEARGRFVRELEVAKRVARFCTAQVLDADVDGDRPYIVSEYVPGVALQDLVEREGPRGGAALERLAVSTLTALTAIHGAGIIHRDFKPHNVLLGDDGPRVIDFGIARALNVTSHSHNIGSPAYMSPEQLSGRQLTAASDLFSWGSAIVFAATGEPPFGVDEIGAVMYRIINDEPDLGALPQPLRGVVAACLAKDPALRPTAAEAQAALVGGTVPDPLDSGALGGGIPASSGEPVSRPVAHAMPAPHSEPDREPYPFEIGPPPGESDALAGRGPTIVIAIVIALMLAIGVTGWALTRGGGDKADDADAAVTVSPGAVAGGQLPSGPQGPAPSSSGSGKSPTPRPSTSASATPSGKATSGKPSAVPTTTVTVTETASPSETPTPPEEPTPTPTPTPTETVNPYGAVQVCESAGRGIGFRVVRARAFTGGRVVHLFNPAIRTHCVVTLKTADIGVPTDLWARVTRKSDKAGSSDRGLQEYYAGPLFIRAPRDCVRVAGGGVNGSATAGWGTCA
ncbi:serine/threonine-protein kinase [Actinocorallia sp. A-T 12471]|uniref:serine/threonine-protein kinase n=1 Tax=Actinocorallia sp. A-T 12471 TaxID=3089813 RepID=UPI0029CFA8CA|nr:protein kinase [Actinocorallia sp. A-T 12471]MDX6743560.1 protein kinase [Actinocorallia sp. A-T 12471]